MRSAFILTFFLTTLLLAPGCGEKDSDDTGVESVDGDGDGYGVEVDCDDGDPAVFPGAIEICNDIDDDCDEQVDELAADAATWYTDADADGFGDADDIGTVACEGPTGFVDDRSDCDDTDPATYPGVDELCDGVDRDCNGVIDDDYALDAATWYVDADADGYGDASSSSSACLQPSSYVADATDCDDHDNDIHPEADELCNGEDDDCDGDVDEDDALDVATWYADADDDSFGDARTAEIDCDQPSGFVTDDTDCDDADDVVNPGADEYCNGVDDDCDGATDEDDAVDAGTWYEDRDHDGYGDSWRSTTACLQPSGFITDGSDCDDSDAAFNPGAYEFCGGGDEDCDGSVDEDDAADAGSWYADVDGDGFGDVSAGTTACTQPSGFVTDESDCDDGDAGVNPGATELCNTVDDDCDGTTDEAAAADAPTWYADDDGDSFGDPDASTAACAQPSAYVADDTDCDDRDAAINTDAQEVCDGLDNDCDELVDDDDAPVTGTSTWYRDSDGDGWGLGTSTATACTRPTGYVADDGDCDDGAAAVNPAATELCNVIDDDCDGDTDEADATDASTWYADADADGYGDATSTTIDACDQPTGYVTDSSDCDDSDTSINPGATEIFGDWADNDCDGTSTIAMSGAAARLIGEAPYDYAGYSVSGAGDVDSDGFDDLLVGARCNDEGGGCAGAAYLVLGPVSGDLDLGSADARLVGEEVMDYAGISVSGAGDVDGDGFDDLLVGAYDGAAYLVLGPVSGDFDLGSADARLIGEAATDYAGFSVSGAGDVDGDGFDDLLVGAFGNDTGGVEAGTAYLVLGPVSGALDLSGARARLIGEASADYAGQSVSGAGDVDGDGFDDLLVGAPQNGTSGSRVGAGYMVLGPVSGDLDLGSADARLIGEDANDNAGSSVSGAGDVNGDGFDDLLVGADDAGGSGAGVAYLVLGPVSGDIDLGSADARLIGEDDWDHVGDAVSGAGDADGDGFDDLLVGAFANDAGGSRAGSAYLVLGPVSGGFDLGSADARLIGEVASDEAGCSVSGAGDVDGDGFDDLLAGAWSNDLGGTDAGAAYLF
jgi:hypothetical protein